MPESAQCSDEILCDNILESWPHVISVRESHFNNRISERCMIESGTGCYTSVILRLESFDERCNFDSLRYVNENMFTCLPTRKEYATYTRSCSCSIFFIFCWQLA